MKNLKISDYKRICRLCLKIGSNLNKLQEISDELCEKIEIVAAVQINLQNELPKQVCTNCIKTINKFIDFRESCAKSAEMLNLHYLINQDDESTAIVVENPHPIDIKLEMHDRNDAIKPESHIPDIDPVPNEVRKSTRKRKLNKFIEAITSFTSIREERDEDDDADLEKLRDRKNHSIEICEKCSAPVKSFLLEYHLNEHNQIYPFPCSICNKQFSSPFKLKRHKFGVHKYAQEIKCPDCGIMVKGTQNLLRHKRGVHLKEYRSACNICNIKFTTRESSKRHAMIHFNLKPFDCQICGAKFRTKSNLKTHMRIHTNEKPFKCEICDANFAYNAALKKHVQEHVNDNILM